MKHQIELTRETALAFLNAHQPMPDTRDDASGWKDVIDEWKLVCEYFHIHRSDAPIPLILRSFGGGDGGGAYRRFGDIVFHSFPEKIEPYFIEALTTNSYSLPARVQAAKASAEMRSENSEFHEVLLSRVEDPNEDDEVRYACATAFAFIGFRGLFDVDKYRERIETVIAKEREENKVYDYVLYFQRPRDIIEAFDGFLLRAKEQGLEFLRAHQPMPDTDDLTINCEDWVREWERVCEHFTNSPCIEALPLFFGSFGGGDGYGVYQTLNGYIEKLDPEEAAPYFVEALNSPSAAVREQVSEFTIEFESSNPEYIETLWQRVEDSNEIPRIRSWCSGALTARGEEGSYDFSQCVDRIKRNIEKLEEYKNDRKSSLRYALKDLQDLLDSVSK